MKFAEEIDQFIEQFKGRKLTNLLNNLKENNLSTFSIPS